MHLFSLPELQEQKDTVLFLQPGMGVFAACFWQIFCAEYFFLHRIQQLFYAKAAVGGT